MANTLTQQSPTALDAQSFRSFQQKRGDPQWLKDLRERAWGRFSKMSWPTPQEEEWRRTDLSRMALGEFRVPSSQRIGAGESNRSDPGEPSDYSGSIRFLGGELAGMNVGPEAKQSGIVLAPLSRSVQNAALSLRGLIENGHEVSDNRLQAWHDSLWSYGAYLYVPPGVQVLRSFLIDLTMQGEKTLSVPRVILHLARGARAHVILKTKSSSAEAVLCNAGLQIMVEENASLSLCTLQNLNHSSLFFSHAQARLARDARLQSFETLFGGQLAKTRLDCRLTGTGSEALLRGLYFGAQGQHFDIRTVQRHLAPSTNSRSFYKGAVKDKARSIYQGLIEVSPKAAKTDAYLANRNLVLNDGARSDSIPSLKIDTNDVRCSHGSTTGKINPDEVFYLMSRGLSRGQAERLLVLGFFEELLQHAPPEVADKARQLIQERL